MAFFRLYRHLRRCGLPRGYSIRRAWRVAFNDLTDPKGRRL